MTWKALGWRDRVAALRMRAGAVVRRAARTRRVRARERPSGSGSSQHGQTPRLIEMLWEPLAVAALNQSIDEAAAASFAAVLRPHVRPQPARRRARAAVEAARRDVCAIRRARIIEERGWRGSRVEARHRFAAITCSFANERADGGRAIICAVPWHALSDLLPERPAGARPRARRRAIGRPRRRSSPSISGSIASVTDRTLVGLPGPDAAVGVRQARGLFGGAGVLAPLARFERRRGGGRAQQPGAHRPGDGRGVRGASRRCARRRCCAASSSARNRRRSRWRRASRRARATKTGVPGLFLAGDWIDTGLPATIESAVISGHWAAAARARIYG